MPWYSQPVDQVLEAFGSTPNGLSVQEAAWRLAANGPNELKEARPISPLQILLGQFKSLIIWILVVAGLVSGAGRIQDWSADSRVRAFLASDRVRADKAVRAPV